MPLKRGYHTGSKAKPRKAPATRGMKRATKPRKQTKSR